MTKLSSMTTGIKMLSQIAFFGGNIKVAYKVLPYKSPTFEADDKPVSVAFKVNDKIYVGEPSEGEIMHFLLLANLPMETQNIFYELNEETSEICSGFYTKEGCFYTREQNQEFFGFNQSYDGLEETQNKLKKKPKIEVIEDNIPMDSVTHKNTL